MCELPSDEGKKFDALLSLLSLSGRKEHGAVLGVITSSDALRAFSEHLRGWDASLCHVVWLDVASVR